ncbi:carbohydrate kinase family protein [Kiloniella laminariae]|uniref:carbohydrate kinase family protein n=1 Tax=Kiloniella laminariae TaxID=454162 RepID=UPI00036E0D7D|nr:carbohydrate kinase family protein [Kiloniella laminariae]
MKALALGGATVDIIASVSDDEIERMTMHNAITNFLLLEEGKKVEAETIETHTGGGAINASVSMAKLGLDISCVVKLGDDIEGQMVLKRLEQTGIDSKWVINGSELPTGCAVMVSSHVRNPTIFVARGANTLLTPDEITPEMFADVGLTYVTGLSGASADCFPKIVRLAKEAGSLVVANPGIRQLTSRTQSFWDSLAHIDVLVLNEVEAARLLPFVSAKSEQDFTGCCAYSNEKNLPELLKKGVGIPGARLSLEGFVSTITQFGPKQVLVTNGKEGAYLGTDQEIVFCPAQKARVMGTAGAGDSFASTFSAFIAVGQGDETALKAAAINAASVVSVMDTQSGLLGKDEILQRIPKSDWGKFNRYPAKN